MSPTPVHGMPRIPLSFSGRFAQRGVGLVEVLVSATLGLVVLAGVFQVYVDSKQSQRVNNAVFRLQESGRAAINLMRNSLSMAGYMADFSSNFETVFPARGGFAKGAALLGHDNDQQADNGVKDGTDWFLVRYQGDASDGLVLDCVGNALPAGNPAYPRDVFPMAFAVSENNELYCDPGLGGASSRVVIAEDVEDMQVNYGVDTDADGVANYYVSAGDVADFSKVVGLRLSLLVRSADRIASAPTAYTFNGATVADPGDRRLRFVFGSTIQLRNL